jgi:hypothetical protein
VSIRPRTGRAGNQEETKMTRKANITRDAHKQRPKLARERLKDLSADAVADQIRGGLLREPGDRVCSYLAGQNPNSCE